MPDSILEDDKYFQRFNLYLPPNVHNEKSPLHGLNHSTLGEKADTFDLRTIRSIVIKQLSPRGDGSIFEIFNRLNTGGVNLRPQEMRSSLYHSEFFSALHRLNALADWRTVLGVPHPDVRMKDSEVLLRALAMLVNGKNYKPSMVKFLNQFSKDSRACDATEVALRESIASRFISAASAVGPEVFQLQSTKLSVPLFEAVFCACCQDAYTSKSAEAVRSIDPAKVDALKHNGDFVRSISSNSADTSNVRTRLDLASKLL
jgi:hypothetical protein